MALRHYLVSPILAKAEIYVALMEHLYQNFRTISTVKRSAQGPIPFEKILVETLSKDCCLRIESTGISCTYRYRGKSGGVKRSDLPTGKE